MMLNELRYVLAYLFYSQIILLPLGIWKLIDIIIWVIKHVHIGIN